MARATGIVGVFDRLYRNEISVEQADMELMAIRKSRGVFRGFFASLTPAQQAAALSNTEVDV